MSAEFVDQDDYFDDDSDVPSHFDPSEELEESLLEEAVNFEPEHVEIENSTMRNHQFRALLASPRTGMRSNWM